MSQSRFVSASRSALLLVGALVLVQSCTDSGPTGPAVVVSVAPTAATVTAGLTTTLVATVTNHSNTAVTWSVQELGSGGTVSAAGVYTAPATPGTYHVIATSVARSTKSDTATITVVAVPSITAFTAAAGTLTVGGSTMLTATFSGGAGSVNQSIGTVATGVAVTTGALAATRVYTLTVTNAAGTAVTAQTTVTVVPAPVITSFTATPGSISVGSSSTLLGVFSNGVGYVAPGSAITSGVGLSTGPLAASTTRRLVVKNAAGDSVTADVSITVVALPTITSFTAAPDTIPSGASAMLTAVFAGGTAYVNPGTMAITSGVGLSTGALTVGGTTTFTYTVVVKNAAGDSVMSNATVTVVAPAPVISAFTATPTTITLGDSTTLAWTATGATSLSINQGVGTVTGTSVRVAPTGTLVYTLTATNGSGSVTATANVTVVPAPSITSFTATPSAVVAGGASSLRAVFSQGTGVVNQAIGAVTSGTPTPTGAIAGTTTYTLTVTNLAGRTATSTATVAVDPGFYVTTNPMTVARQNHATVMLANGTVLALAGSPATATAETYDATPDAWAATTGTMTVARNQPTAVLLADGRVLVTGGQGSADEFLSSAELYDPATRTFTATGAMNSARARHGMILLQDGRVLVAGGHTTGGGAVATAELYNPTTGTFATTGSMGSARFLPRLTPLSGGDVLVMGGGASSGDGTSIEIYGLSAGTFGPTGGTTGGWLNGATRLIDGSVFGVSASVAKRWAAGTATATGPMLRQRAQAAISILPSGDVLVVADSGFGALEGISESEIYGQATNTFRLTGKPFESRSYAQANLLRTGNVLISGGFGFAGAGTLASSELYINGTGGTAPAPSATVTAPVTEATGTTGISISVPVTSGARYIWRVTGGTITAGLGTNNITVTAGAAGTMQVRVLVVSELGIPSSGTAAVTVTP